MSGNVQTAVHPAGPLARGPAPWTTSMHRRPASRCAPAVLLSAATQCSESTPSPAQPGTTAASPGTPFRFRSQRPFRRSLASRGYGYHRQHGAALEEYRSGRRRQRR